MVSAAMEAEVGGRLSALGGRSPAARLGPAVQVVTDYDATGLFIV